MPSGTGVKETSVASRHLGNMKLLRTPLHAVSLSHTLRHVCNMYFTAALISPLAFMATWAHMVLIMSSIVIILLKRKRESGKKTKKKHKHPPLLLLNTSLILLWMKDMDFPF